MLTTPDDESRKDYIGNAARHAELAVVFAQLEVGGDVRGRARVRRADPQGRAGRCPACGSRTAGARSDSTASTTAGSGSTACACRATALLNRFADVSPAGAYTSAIENPNRRFFTMLGTLVQGRVCVGGAGINAAKVALTIATGTRDRRRQFDATSEDAGGAAARLRHAPAPAVPAARPHLRAALRAGGRRRPAARGVLRGSADDEHVRRELESRAAGTKALGTWHATRTIQECREACGGAGYLVGEPVRRAQGRHRRVHDLRGRQPRAAAAGRQGPAHRLRQRASRTSTSSGWSGSWPGWPWRPSSRRPTCTS